MWQRAPAAACRWFRHSRWIPKCTRKMGMLTVCPLHHFQTLGSPCHVKQKGAPQPDNYYSEQHHNFFLPSEVSSTFFPPSILFFKFSQCCVGFRRTKTQISHNHTYILSVPSHPPPNSTPPGHRTGQTGLPVAALLLWYCPVIRDCSLISQGKIMDWSLLKWIINFCFIKQPLLNII